MRVLAALFTLILAACQTPGTGPERPPRGQDIGEMCGGMMGLYCESEEAYCAYPRDAMCGAADQTGTCRERPEVCTQQYDPVCGCDGETYPNACEAAAAGASVSYEGVCRTPSG